MKLRTFWSIGRGRPSLDPPMSNSPYKKYTDWLVNSFRMVVCVNFFKSLVRLFLSKARLKISWTIRMYSSRMCTARLLTISRSIRMVRWEVCLTCGRGLFPCDYMNASPCKQIKTCKNITFPMLGIWAVKTTTTRMHSSRMRTARLRMVAGGREVL